MAKHFLFVIIQDTELVSLFTELRKIFCKTTHTSPIHITLRGPQKHPIEAPLLRQATDDIHRSPVLLNGTGQFIVNDTIYIYLKASSVYLEKYMFKPDFPKNKFNTNPHITLYEGSDLNRAKKIQSFLAKEIKPLYSHNFEIASHLSKQLTLPFVDPCNPSDKEVINLIKQGKIKKGIFERASKI